MQNHDRRNHARPAPLSDTPDAIRADLDALVAERGDITTARPAGCVDIDTPSLDAARTLHLRRQLAQAAEHGAALLTSLGLPRLVGPDFMPLDPAAIGEAVEAAVAALDAIDGDPDLEEGGDDEPSLASPISGAPVGGSDDREEDHTDREPSLGWPEDYTAKDTKRGPGFDEMEDDGQDLEDDELGDDRDPDPLAWVFGPSRGEVAHV